MVAAHAAAATGLFDEIGRGRQRAGQDRQRDQAT
jgi:hypothetical protein